MQIIRKFLDKIHQIYVIDFEKKKWPTINNKDSSKRMPKNKCKLLKIRDAYAIHSFVITLNSFNEILLRAVFKYSVNISRSNLKPTTIILFEFLITKL